MKYLVIILLLISRIGFAECIKIINIRVDDSFSCQEKIIINRALNSWHIASNKQICFNVLESKIHPEEIFLFNFDKVSTIYNNNLWEVIISISKYNCILSCIAITTKGLNNDPSDIFVVVKYKLYPLIIHEVGHLLGIQHSQNNKDIMYGYINNNEKISVNDKNVLRCLIENDLLLTWKSKCRYEDKINVVLYEWKNTIRYIKDKIGFPYGFGKWLDFNMSKKKSLGLE